MSFLRGTSAEAVVWPRFRTVDEGFAVWREAPWWVARTDAPAERTVQCFHELSTELPGTVSVSVARVRDGVEWSGHQVALADVREGIARLRFPVARTGGLVITLWGEGCQLALSAQLAVWTWARTNRWRSALGDLGLAERARAQLGDRRWASRAIGLAGSAELDEVTHAVVARLGLSAATPSRRD